MGCVLKPLAGNRATHLLITSQLMNHSGRSLVLAEAGISVECLLGRRHPGWRFLIPWRRPKHRLFFVTTDTALIDVPKQQPRKPKLARGAALFSTESALSNLA